MQLLINGLFDYGAYVRDRKQKQLIMFRLPNYKHLYGISFTLADALINYVINDC